jgi:hypothetical protein
MKRHRAFEGLDRLPDPRDRIGTEMAQPRSDIESLVGSPREQPVEKIVAFLHK